MKFKISILLTALVFFHAWSLSANEGPPPAEGGGHGGGAPAEGAPSAATTFESGRQSMEWIELLAKLSAAKGKLDAQKALVMGLVSQKDGISKQDELKKHVDLIIEENKKLNKSIDEYESIKALLKYRFPERGIKELRKYERVEKQTIESIETEISTEGQLKKSLAKMRKQFKVVQPKTPEESSELNSNHDNQLHNKEKSHIKATEPVQPPDSVTDSIIISR